MPPQPPSCSSCRETTTHAQSILTQVKFSLEEATDVYRKLLPFVRKSHAKHLLGEDVVVLERQLNKALRRLEGLDSSSAEGKEELRRLVAVGDLPLFKWDEREDGEQKPKASAPVLQLVSDWSFADLKIPIANSAIDIRSPGKVEEILLDDEVMVIAEDTWEKDSTEERCRELSFMPILVTPDLPYVVKGIRLWLEKFYASRDEPIPLRIIKQLERAETKLGLERLTTTDCIWNINHQLQREEVFTTHAQGVVYREKCQCGENPHQSDIHCPKNIPIGLDSKNRYRWDPVLNIWISKVPGHGGPPPPPLPRNNLSDAGSDTESETEEQVTVRIERGKKEKKEMADKAWEDMMAMTGLKGVKEHVRRLKSKFENSRRQNVDLKEERFGAVFMGNSGTGKTTMARIYAKYLYASGIISRDVVVETTGTYLSDGGIERTKRYIERLDGGGVMFIDDAMTLDDYSNGTKILDFIMREIDNRKGEAVFILAGHEKGMRKLLGHGSKSVASLLPNVLTFHDFSEPELLQILGECIKKKFDSKMEVEGGYDGLYMRIAARRVSRTRGISQFGNARAVENLVAQIWERQSARLATSRKLKEVKAAEEALAAALGAAQKLNDEIPGYTKPDEAKDSKEKEAGQEKDGAEAKNSETVEAPESQTAIGEIPNECNETAKEVSEQQGIELATKEENSESLESVIGIPLPDETTALKDVETPEEENSGAQPQVEQIVTALEEPEISEAKIVEEIKSTETLNPEASNPEEPTSEASITVVSKADEWRPDEPKPSESDDMNITALKIATPKPEEKKIPLGAETVAGDDAPKEAPKKASSETEPEKNEQVSSFDSKPTEKKAQESQDPKPEKSSDEKESCSGSTSGGSDSDSDSDAGSDADTDTTPSTPAIPVDPEDLIFTKEDILGPDPSDAILNSQAWQELQNLIGLEKVKTSLLSMLELVKTNYQRELEEKPLHQFTLNRLFIGPAGTGKTVVAKLYAKILGEIGVLSKGEVIFRNPSDLIGQYIGDSEANTKAALNAAIGNVLVIDEAYMMYTGNSDGTGNESDSFRQGIIDTIVAEVQGNPGDDRAVLLLGYKDPMLEMLNHSNPGLSRRFPIGNAFWFENFTIEELEKILRSKIESQVLEATEEAIKVAMDVLQKASTRLNFGNGGEVENLIATARSNYQLRMSGIPINDRPNKWVFQPEDFDPEYDRGKSAHANLRKLFSDVVGCQNIVKQLGQYQNVFKAMKSRGVDPRPYIPTNFVFKGPPGTGKTTTARKFAKVYYDMGLLSDQTVIECSASDLVGKYVGHSGPKTTKVLEKALGKVLFIDEAYRLAPHGESYSFSSEVVSELVDLLTKPKFHGNLIVILAGYEEEINSLLSANPGLASRFPDEMNFPPLKPLHCLKILEMKLKIAGIEIPVVKQAGTREYEALLRLMTFLTETHGWGNARDVETLAKSICRNVFLGSAGMGVEVDGDANEDDDGEDDSEGEGNVDADNDADAEGEEPKQLVCTAQTATMSVEVMLHERRARAYTILPPPRYE